MDIVKFQQKLEEICTLGEENGKVLTPLQVRECFQGMELDKNQLLKVLQYLKLKGISIEGMEVSPAAEDAASEVSEEEKKVSLTAEEEAYVKEYLEELKTAEKGERAHFMRAAAEMAVEMNCEEIYIADLIQEANLSFLMAADEAKAAGHGEEWILGRIRAGIRRAIEEQTQRKFEDDYLVSKVEKLEAAVKELTDDEEENRFSVDELAVILDMDVEEIRDVLRLTGDDK